LVVISIAVKICFLSSLTQKTTRVKNEWKQSIKRTSTTRCKSSNDANQNERQRLYSECSEDHCAVCLNRLVIFAVGRCNHPGSVKLSKLVNTNTWFRLKILTVTNHILTSLTTFIESIVVCGECSTRMRILCNQNECPICRQDLPKVTNL